MNKYIFFLFLAVATLYLGVWYKRYLPVGSALLPALQLDNKNSTWHSYGLQGAVIQESAEVVRLHSNDPTKSVGLKFPITEPSRFHYLQLSADLRTENVVAGKQSWQKARLLLSSHDAKGKWLPQHHHVVTLEGDNPWQHYTEAFTISDTAAQLRVGVQLPRATGTLWVRNLNLQEVVVKPVYWYGSYVIELIWSFFLLWLLAPYFNRGSRWLLRGGLSLVLMLTFVGILLPGNLKVQMLAQGKEWLQSCTQIWSQNVSSDAVTGVALLPWFDVAKLGHFLIFALLARVLVFAWPERNRYYILTDLLMLAAATELLQLFVVGRSPLFTDWLIDGGGIVLGLCLSGKAMKHDLSGV
ncbi:MAG: VanZ family protein [Gimesia sp.]